MKKAWLSNAILVTLSLAFVGGLIATFVAPSLITWYAKPAVDLGFDCAPTATWATSTLLKWQLWGSVIGVILGFAFKLYLAYRRRENLDESVTEM